MGGTSRRPPTTWCLVQVWLTNNNERELYVVLFNSGRGSCATPSPPTRWEGPLRQAYSDAECPNKGNHPGKTVAECEALCSSTSGCDAFNYGLPPAAGRALRGCATAAALRSPGWTDAQTVSYRLNATAAGVPPVRAPTFQVRPPLCIVAD